MKKFVNSAKIIPDIRKITEVLRQPDFGDNLGKMNTVEIIINLFGTIAVVLSVVFLAFQIKQNTDAVKANFYDSLNNSNIEFIKQLVEHERLGKLFEIGAESWKSMNDDDKRTANFLFIQLYRHWENMFYQNKMKIFESWLWESHKNTMVSYFHKQGIKEWWSYRKHSFSKEFASFLENSKKPNEIYQTVKELSSIEQNSNKENKK